MRIPIEIGFTGRNGLRRKCIVPGWPTSEYVMASSTKDLNG